jgi:hypothetical protein
MSRSRRQSLTLVVPIAVGLLLTAFQLGSIEPGGCIDSPVWIDPDTPTEVTIDQPSWFLFERSWGTSVYRLEVTGPDGSPLELWEVFFDSGAAWCWEAQRPISDDVIDGGSSELLWPDSWTDTGLYLTPPDEQESTYTVTFSEAAAVPDGDVVVIPAVANTPGAEGTLFRSDVRILNPYSFPNDVEVELVETQDGVSVPSILLELEPLEIANVSDIVRTRFGLTSTASALRLSGSGIVAASRTYNETDAGTFGQFIAAEPWDRSIWPGSWNDDDGSSRLLGLANTNEHRSNVGFVEVLGLDAEITLELYDATGSSIGQAQLTLPAGSHRQINDVFSFLGAGTHEAAWALVTVTNLSRIFTYASVIDNRTGDPVFIPGTSDVNSLLTIPAAASTEGVLDSQWRTDLHILPINGASSVQVTFLGTDGATAAKTFNLTGTGLLVLRDVVAELGATGNGALRLEVSGTSPDPYTYVGAAAVSRTYNVTDHGTYGQLIPADSGSVVHGTVLGVESSEQYRTNIGMLTVGDEALEVLVSLISESGTLLASRVWTLQPDRPVQVNDIFGALNVPPQGNCRVDFESQARYGWHWVLAYASIIDNRTGDPIYVPATALPDEATVRLELDNRSNAILIDQLGGAVGTDQLPAGELTATVTGSGDLGRSDLPLRAVCLYKDPAGALLSAVLSAGDTLEGIAGGERFWCVVPDWISAADNTGQLAIDLTGGDSDLQLVLDARDNSVLLDRQTAAVVVQRPAKEAYTVELTGDLGRPELAPQPVVLYRDDAAGVLQLKAPIHGDTITPIDSSFQLVAAVFDWIDRDDNTGSTVLEPTCTSRTLACAAEVHGTVTQQDCRSGPSGALNACERITFAGSTEQVVTITVTWHDEHDTGFVTVLDPDGGEIASLTEYNADPIQEITDLTLEATGTYEIWVSKRSPYQSDPVPYTLALECE